MAKAKGKKSKRNKSSVKVKDIAPRKNPKGGEGEKVNISDLPFIKKIDKSSPILL